MLKTATTPANSAAQKQSRQLPRIKLEYIYPLDRWGARRGRPSLYMVKYENGKRYRRYVPREMELAARNILAAQRRHKPQRKKPLPKASKGRPAYYPDIFLKTLKSAGYAVKGREIKRNLKTFFLLKACRERYHFFLSPEVQETIGSPEFLQGISLRAESLLKASCRLGQKLRFDDCFALAVNEHIKKKQQRQKSFKQINGDR